MKQLFFSLFAALLILMPGSVRAEEPVALKEGTIKSVNIDQERLVVISGDIMPETETFFREEIEKIEKGGVKKPVYLIIDTYGGDLNPTVAIIDLMESKEYDFVCIVDNKAMSAGAFIFSFCDERYIQSSAILMYHEAIIAVGPVPETKFLGIVKTLIKMNDRLYRRVADKLGLNYELFRNRLRTDWYMTSDQALKEGVVKAVVLDKPKYSQAKLPKPKMPLFNLLPM